MSVGSPHMAASAFQKVTPALSISSCSLAPSAASTPASSQQNSPNGSPSPSPRGPHPTEHVYQLFALSGHEADNSQGGCWLPVVATFRRVMGSSSEKGGKPHGRSLTPGPGWGLPVTALESLKEQSKKAKAKEVDAALNALGCCSMGNLKARLTKTEPGIREAIKGLRNLVLQGCANRLYAEQQSVPSYVTLLDSWEFNADEQSIAPSFTLCFKNGETTKQAVDDLLAKMREKKLDNLCAFYRQDEKLTLKFKFSSTPPETVYASLAALLGGPDLQKKTKVLPPFVPALENKQEIKLRGDLAALLKSNRLSLEEFDNLDRGDLYDLACALDSVLPAEQQVKPTLIPDSDNRIALYTHYEHHVIKV